VSAKTVCSRHEIAHEVGTPCPYCDDKPARTAVVDTRAYDAWSAERNRPLREAMERVHEQAAPLLTSLEAQRTRDDVAARRTLRTPVAQARMDRAAAILRGEVVVPYVRPL
jgi:hypothetical protein